MIPRASRLALSCLALLLSVSLYVKGRVPAREGEGAAFNVSGSRGQVTVRLAGDLPRPGVYRFPDGTSAAGAIKMTVPDLELPPGATSGLPARLRSGDLVTLVRKRGQAPVLSTGSMGTRERMLLGIPLDPDRLSADDWALLPGIGPVLAARIVEDRHKNGAFGGLQGVLRVPGIGPGRLAAVKSYF